MFWRKPPLRGIEYALQKAGYTTRFVPAGQDTLIESVVVHLGSDYRERAVFLELALVSAAHTAMRGDHSEGSSRFDEVDYLQFYAELPFQVEQGFVPDVAQLVLQLNRILPLVGFGLRVSERTIYYRYMMMFEGRQGPNHKLLVKAVEVIRFLLQEFCQAIEDVATGKKTLAQVKAGIPQMVQTRDSHPSGPMAVLYGGLSPAGSSSQVEG